MKITHFEFFESDSYEYEGFASATFSTFFWSKPQNIIVVKERDLSVISDRGAPSHPIHVWYNSKTGSRLLHSLSNALCIEHSNFKNQRISSKRAILLNEMTSEKFKNAI